MRSLPNIGDLVVVNDLPDATIWRVVETHGLFRVSLIDDAAAVRTPNLEPSRIDRDFLMTPTKVQLRNHKERKKEMA